MRFSHLVLKTKDVLINGKLHSIFLITNHSSDLFFKNANLAWGNLLFDVW